MPAWSSDDCCASLSLNANILPVFEQLGLLGEVEKISKPVSTLDLYHESLKPIGSINIEGFKTQAGYDSLILHRPALYEILLKHVPSEKISLNKKVVAVEQTNEGVTIRTSDCEAYHGHILVGADGAYSTVRRLFFKEMIEKNELPASDIEAPKVGHICLVGTTSPLDPEQYPELKDGRCYFRTIIGHAKAHTWVTTTLPDNRISFSIKEQLDEKKAKEAAFRNTEWTGESNAMMIQEVSGFPVLHGRPGDDRVLGDLFAATPTEMISKVFLEEKIYETWYHDRSVLIGDACHKMQPSAGQGAINAMEDAVVLANCLYDICEGKEAVTSERITEAFRDYHEQRYHHAKFQVENSGGMAKILNGQTWGDWLLRTVLYNMPKWIFSHNYLKQAGYRPQIMFMPTVSNPPDLVVVPQKPSKRYLAEQAERN
ncbi:hypothetical protein BGZ58_007910 [Dissophora ornata]|nr:hypothetical protein BGZ58_007910 [Dissophora ornata]